MTTLWLDIDPWRQRQDVEDVSQFAPDLEFIAPHSEPGQSVAPHGGWRGDLPIWPFDRPEPSGLDELLEGTGLSMLLAYPASYPMVPPRIYPRSPRPEPIEHSDQVWHVAPAGHLCLLQSNGDWAPETSVTELLIKAAGWRIEYALMKRRRISQMSINGIVSDSSLDHLMQAAVADES